IPQGSKDSVVTRTMASDPCQHPVIAYQMSSPNLAVVFTDVAQTWRREFQARRRVAFVVDEGMPMGAITEIDSIAEICVGSVEDFPNA
ncbi:hypothetical protein BVRB_032120, partial [Beta vulgaris subsp. vulgaris]